MDVELAPQRAHTHTHTMTARNGRKRQRCNDKVEVEVEIAPVREMVYGPPHMLHYAVRWNNAAAVASILAADDGELLDSYDTNGMTPVMTAAFWNSSVEIVKMLCTVPVDMLLSSSWGETALHLAIRRASPEVQAYMAVATQKAIDEFEEWCVANGVEPRSS